MAKFFEELGKHLLNFALALVIALVFQPIVQGHSNHKFILWASLGYPSLITASFILFYLSDKLKSPDEKER